MSDADDRPRDHGSAHAVADVATGVVTLAAMIATPLLAQGGRGRRVLSSVVIGGLFATTASNSIRRWGTRRALGAAGSTAVVTGIIERVGTRTGLPFGRYGYTGALRPQIAQVPVIVPLAWFAMALPSREVAHAALGESSSTARRLGLGAVAMTAWDLFLDPQMVGEGYWSWARRGVYRGIPLTNYLGWLVTAAGVMALLEGFLPHDDESVADRRLTGTYTSMAVMETVGFARYFRDPLVATVGGAAMLPIAAAAWLRRRR